MEMCAGFLRSSAYDRCHIVHPRFAMLMMGDAEAVSGSPDGYTLPCNMISGVPVKVGIRGWGHLSPWRQAPVGNGFGPKSEWNESVFGRTVPLRPLR